MKSHPHREVVGRLLKWAASRERLIAVMAVLGAAALALVLVPVLGQGSPIAQLQAGGSEVRYHDRTGLIRFYSAGDETVQRALQTAESSADAKADSQAVALTFLNSFGPLFGVRAPNRELTLDRQTEGERGRSFLRYRQLYQGVPVMAGELILQVAGGTVLSANGEVSPVQNLNATPSLSKEDAGKRALSAVAKSSGLPADQLAASEPELWVYDPQLLAPDTSPARLVWRTEVGAPTQGDIRRLVLVDARLGAIVLNLDLVQPGLSRAVYDNNNVELNLPGNGPVRSEGEPATGINDVNLAYDYLGDTYNYYLTHYGRNSYDNAGAQLIATVRFCDIGSSCPYRNAFWDGRQLAFGDGMVTDDILAHEYTHAVTEHTSGLFYMFQSGAINESLSDIWGELVDLAIEQPGEDPADRWLIAEDLVVGAIRDMADPTAFGDPDSMTSALWNCGNQSMDMGGVHTNSGVLNKAAYLIADGGTFNGYTVNGIGLDKMGAVFYELQTRYLTSGSDYQDVGSLLPQACDGLMGIGGITPDDCRQVRLAVSATEMTSIPAACGFSEAPVCLDGLSCIDLFFDDLENPTSGNWTKQSLVGRYLDWYYPQNTHDFYDFDATYATSGVTNMWGFDPEEAADFVIAMSEGVLLPAGRTAYLRFHHAFTFDYYRTSNFYDGGVVEYSTDDGTTWQDAGPLFDHNGYNAVLTDGWGNPIGGREAFGGTSYGYTSSRLELSSLAGETVRFRWRIGTDEMDANYGWFVDDIRIYTCEEPTPTPTPSSTPTKTATPTFTPTATFTPTPTPTPAVNYIPFVARTRS